MKEQVFPTPPDPCKAPDAHYEIARQAGELPPDPPELKRTIRVEAMVARELAERIDRRARDLLLHVYEIPVFLRYALKRLVEEATELLASTHSIEQLAEHVTEDEIWRKIERGT